MPECYASSQRVDSLARVVITPLRHTHTRLHILSSKAAAQQAQDIYHLLVQCWANVVDDLTKIVPTLVECPFFAELQNTKFLQNAQV